MSALVENFVKFAAENPHVYKLIKKFTYQTIAAGRDSYSINGVFERVRWHTDIETVGEDYKINNNHRPYYARAFMYDHPEYDGFFRTKEIENERECNRTLEKMFGYDE
jgi:hypothetical protein